MTATISADTPYGRLIGRRTPGGAAFLGIRYATQRRFRPPEPLRRAPGGGMEALRPGPAPTQAVRPSAPWAPAAAIGAISEDCLTLNVWTPAVDGARRPVLVHVFGGGFQGGSAQGGVQDGEALAARGDAVVVRVNFRLGALGFLHLGAVWGEPYQAGNVALLDLCAALEWVRENVRPLGGDPDNVTLFGLSSGAFMIAALFAAPAARGLFRRAWMQSGAASRIIGRDVAAGQAAEFLAVLGIRPGDAAALAAAEVADILAAQERIVATDLGARNAPGGRTLGIVADGVTVTDHPLAAIGAGAARGVPMVLGMTREEARLWFALGVMQPTASEDDLRQEMARFCGPDRVPALLAAYRAAWPGAAPALLRERFLTDAVYRVPAWRTASAQVAAGGRAYCYEFAWTPPYGNGRLGAAHGFDEPFVWGVADRQRVPFIAGAEAEAAALAEALSATLLRFARADSPGWPSGRGRVFPGDPDEPVPPPAILRAWEGIPRP